MYWNDQDVTIQARRARGNPIRMEGVLAIVNLMRWTNSNSDGWAYWNKPVNAAKNLMTLLETGEEWEPEDVSAADLKKAMVPIKSFLTRQGVNHKEMLNA